MENLPSEGRLEGVDGHHHPVEQFAVFLDSERFSLGEQEPDGPFPDRLVGYHVEAAVAHASQQIALFALGQQGDRLPEQPGVSYL